mgnify:FL=1
MPYGILSRFDLLNRTTLVNVHALVEAEGAGGSVLEALR